MVGKNNFHLCTAGADQITIIAHIIHTREFVTVLTKKLAILFKAQYIAVWIHTGLIQLLDGYQLVSNLIAWIASKQPSSHPSQSPSDRLQNGSGSGLGT